MASYLLTIPKLFVEFENHFEQAKVHFISLVYSSKKWNGIFDTSPDGFVDMNDLNILSEVDAALELNVVDGNHLSGRIWWEGSCDIGSPYAGLILEGDITIGGSSADVVVLEFIGGHRIDLFAGRLRNDGIRMQLLEFPKSTGLNDSIIIKNPEPAKLDSWQELHCDWFSNVIEGLHQQ